MAGPRVLVGTAPLPSAPVLVPGVSATLPAGAGAVCEASDATARAKLGPARRHYSAPCRVGYLVVGGA